MCSHFQATSQTLPGACFYMAAGLTLFAQGFSIFIHLHLRGERLSSYDANEESEEDSDMKVKRIRGRDEFTKSYVYVAYFISLL